MKRKSFIHAICTVTLFLLMALPSFAGQTLIAKKVNQDPNIDGIVDETLWSQATAIVTHDEIAQIDITLKAVYTAQHVFFLIIFPDPDESRIHKNWVWNNELRMYEMGKEREDVFVLKWNLLDHDVDLTLKAEYPYKADIWFWKANRTDPVGYADDKYQVLSSDQLLDSDKIKSRSGKTLYLLRNGDAGKPAYQTKLPPPEYTDEFIPRYINQEPTDNRADIRAKGVWQNQQWTLEFKRTLQTDQNNDVQFNVNKEYQFAVSRYEIAGRKENPKLAQPLYGSGEVHEHLTLKFEKEINQP